MCVHGGIPGSYNLPGVPSTVSPSGLFCLERGCFARASSPVAAAAAGLTADLPAQHPIASSACSCKTQAECGGVHDSVRPSLLLQQRESIQHVQRQMEERHEKLRSSAATEAQRCVAHRAGAQMTILQQLTHLRTKLACLTQGDSLCSAVQSACTHRDHVLRPRPA